MDDIKFTCPVEKETVEQAYEILLTVWSDEEVRYCTESRAFYVSGERVEATPNEIIALDHMLKLFAGIMKKYKKD